MKIIVAVHDLIVEKSHLMPWRTVCEVTKELQIQNHEVLLLSLGSEKQDLHGNLIPKNTREICKSNSSLYDQLESLINDFDPDVIYWPVSWRESKSRTRMICDFNIPIIAWFPGGVYSLSAVVHAINVMGVKKSIPYICEVFANKKKQIGFFKKSGIKAIITMTQTTKLAAIQSGWSNGKCFTILPGKDTQAQLSPYHKELDIHFASWLEGEPYFLFMGPPSGIRGIFELLSAFEVAVRKDKNIRLVCLFRSDATLDMSIIKNKIEKLECKDRIFCTWSSLEKSDLFSFIANSHAIAMPFILVPSEVPLAIIEAMAFDKPIITTSPGGTGDFVSQFGFSPKVGDIEGLATVIYDLANDEKLYATAILATKNIFNSHPTWPQVGSEWLMVAENFDRVVDDCEK